MRHDTIRAGELAVQVSDQTVDGQSARTFDDPQALLEPVAVRSQDPRHPAAPTVVEDVERHQRHPLEPASRCGNRIELVLAHAIRHRSTVS